MGEHARGIELLERAVDVMDRLPFYLGHLGWAYGVAGHTAQAESVLEELEGRSADEWVQHAVRAFVLGALGRNDAAFELLERSLEERDPLIIGTSTFPIYDPLRDDARFADILERAGFPGGPGRPS